METEERKQLDFLDATRKENLKHWIISLSIAKFDLIVYFFLYMKPQSMSSYCLSNELFG